MSSYKDLKKKSKELSAKVRATVSNNEKDGSLPVQIAVFSTKIKEISAKKDQTSINRAMGLKRKMKSLVSDYRRINREAALALEQKLSLK